MKTKPHIDKTGFGSVTVDGKVYAYDIYITLSGEVKKRNKTLSKEIYGSSHTVSLLEAEFVYEEGAEVLIVGSGQNGILELSREAERFFVEKHCRVVLNPSPKAIEEWNHLTTERCLALIHVTC